MRSSWINCVGPESNVKCTYNRQKRRAQRHRGEGHMRAEADIGVKLPKVKDYRESPELERGKERFSLRAFRGSIAVPIT